MHVAVDASRLVREKRGMGRYVRNVLREMPFVRTDVSFSIHAGTGSDDPTLRALLQSIGETAGRAPILSVAELASSTADVVWYPWNFVTPVAARAPIAVTIHDIVPMIQVDHRWWKMWKRAKYRRRYANSVNTSHAILADSAFTAQEIKRVLKADMSKVHEVLLAADDFLPDRSEHAPIIDTLGITGPFFVAVGALEARKNLPVLFAAMRELSKRGVDVPLVLCGPGARLSKAAKAGDERWLKYAGFVSDTELAQLYRRATALVFPSLYEGFGLPPLEALQCGGRVVCADASSVPQVVGDAALMFEPCDVNGLIQQLTRLLNDGALRDDLTKRGAVQAAKFRWRLTAERTLQAFEAAIARFHSAR
ncbi:MAG: glycosyltransferase family 1 protein [Gemmatimonadaceae bacterium]